eukprot:1157605-Pelagomonas_calceolata.AAC.8
MFPPPGERGCLSKVTAPLVKGRVSSIFWLREQGSCPLIRGMQGYCPLMGGWYLKCFGCVSKVTALWWEGWYPEFPGCVSKVAALWSALYFEYLPVEQASCTGRNSKHHNHQMIVRWSSIFHRRQGPENEGSGPLSICTLLHAPPPRHATSQQGGCEERLVKKKRRCSANGLHLSRICCTKLTRCVVMRIKEKCARQEAA